jgi:YD repeat-containing protein
VFERNFFFDGDLFSNCAPMHYACVNKCATRERPRRAARTREEIAMPMTTLRALASPVSFGIALTLATAAYAQQTATYTYDQLGRIITVTYAGGKQIIYSYDAAGNRTQHVVSATTVNRPPIAVDDTKTVTEGTPFTFDPRANDSDPDGNPITVTNVSNGEYGTASIGGGGTSITYTAPKGRVPGDVINYTISDGNNMSASATVALTIANAPPIAVADAITVIRGSAIGVTFDPRTNDSDPGQDPFTVTAKTNGTKGTVTLGAGGTSLTYKPNPAVFGTDSFTYTVTDDQGASATATVNATIQFVNTAPVANNDTAYKLAKKISGMFVSIDPRLNDTDAEGDTLTITSATNGAYGTVTVSGGAGVTYTRTSNYPPPGQFANDVFTYTVSDGYGGTATGTVVVNIEYDNSCTGTNC